MTGAPSAATLITTIDTANLNTIKWGLMRQLFPRFAEEVELGRYVRQLLATRPSAGVRVEHHRKADGQLSEHEFDIYALPG